MGDAEDVESKEEDKDRKERKRKLMMVEQLLERARLSRPY